MLNTMLLTYIGKGHCHVSFECYTMSASLKLPQNFPLEHHKLSSIQKLKVCFWNRRWTPELCCNANGELLHHWARKCIASQIPTSWTQSPFKDCRRLASPHHTLCLVPMSSRLAPQGSHLCPNQSRPGSPTQGQRRQHPSSQCLVPPGLPK